MDATKISANWIESLQSRVQQFLSRFAQTGTDALSSVLKLEELEALVKGIVQIAANESTRH